ncbi:NupC/NupG family nucleoside CNT transporter [Paraferrimonas sp. SM1919]|uniref:NupC/NupG family nucleoside CNT transporter n=1 Tax=Paraferrimonas sp. SM1919 TaxID=2662263 RepID=UPI0013D08F88|nr:NupC/NupG family nucleoside CNT transporter [Paraferrimonas sp. SM1919]
MLMSLVGLAVLVSIAVLFSENRSAINWPLVIKAFALQAGLAAFVLYVPVGQQVLAGMSNAVSGVLGYANNGINFLFGPLTGPDAGFVFALKVLPIIIAFSAIVSGLYYLGVMQFVIKVLGGALQKVLGTSKPESFVATGNIFLGQSESPLLIRPFINNLSRSELFVMMACGMASVAGSVLGGYAGLGVEMKYLIAASFMAAPGALMIAKIVVPESDEVKNLENIEMERSDHQNIFDALAAGALSGMKMAAAVGSMLLAFITVMAMVNEGLQGLTSIFGGEGISLQELLGYVFAPIAWLIGVEWNEAMLAGSFIGQKIVMNEFVAFIDFVNYQATLSEQTKVIVIFALCGFANIGSIAILLGAVSILAPERRSEVAQLGLKAVLSGTIANLMSACLAGIFFTLS